MCIKQARKVQELILQQSMKSLPFKNYCEDRFLYRIKLEYGIKKNKLKEENQMTQ